ncbi:hypothetical protein [Sporichthya polymorpha]|uniref:hypothetical protein n=1 Tax=Sporichthya polymorpha TaxID=35751 RepID=UPI0003606BC3|nr:hypothetical protein [Sporichthya polymorpha]
MTATLVKHKQTQPTARRITPEHRPPTVFGQESPWAIVESGYALAWEAVNDSLDHKPIEVAVTKLLEETGPERRDVLRMAHTYLAFTTFGAPRDAQIDALFNLEEAIGRLNDRERRSVLGRALDRVRAWLSALGHPFRSTGERRRHRTA